MRYIDTPRAPKAVGPYSQAVAAGDFLYLSGQIGLDPATSELATGGVQAQFLQVLANLEAVLEAAGATKSSVVSATLYLASMDDYASINELYGRFFAEHKPARATIEVSRLPKDALVEVSLIAHLPTV
jgi:2-iminobutanoate/2-iminopropanoate deaminase